METKISSRKELMQEKVEGQRNRFYAKSSRGCLESHCRTGLPGQLLLKKMRSQKDNTRTVSSLKMPPQLPSRDRSISGGKYFSGHHRHINQRAYKYFVLEAFGDWYKEIRGNSKYHSFHNYLGNSGYWESDIRYFQGNCIG